MADKVRVRFAPSPTGKLHVGNARTAIMNWLCAKHYGGEFILRIEDTDDARSTAESEKTIIDQLRWLGLDWDEGPVKGGDYGPYRQSERKMIYLEKVAQLMSAGSVYLCFCSKDELVAEREKATKEKRPPGYSGKCRDLTETAQNELREQGRKPVVRFRVLDGKITINDLVQGEITFEGSNFTDFVIQRDDGSCPYNFAAVVDDAGMKITHVIRGNDHVPNTPKQVMIYKALGCDIPEFAHIPMITGKDGARLSKRHGHTSIEEFMNEGYLPEALMNYLSLLSWSSKTGDEILSRDRLVEEFDFNRILRSPASFDKKKLNWLNGKYIRSLTAEQRAHDARPFFEKEDMIENNDDRFSNIIEAVKDNAETFSEFPECAEIFFKESISISGNDELELIESQVSQKVFKEVLDRLIELSENMESKLTVATFQEIMKSIQNETGIKGKDLWMPVRVALTGQMHGPELPKVIEIFGLDKCIRLIRAATKN